MSEEKILSFIDIGTNSARLLVVAVHSNGSYHVLSRIKDVVRLEDGEYVAGKIQPEAVDRLILVMRPVCRSVPDVWRG